MGSMIDQTRYPIRVTLEVELRSPTQCGGGWRCSVDTDRLSPGEISEIETITLFILDNFRDAAVSE